MRVQTDHNKSMKHLRNKGNLINNILAKNRQKGGPLEPESQFEILHFKHFTTITTDSHRDHLHLEFEVQDDFTYWHVLFTFSDFHGF